MQISSGKKNPPCGATGLPGLVVDARLGYFAARGGGSQIPKFHTAKAPYFGTPPEAPPPQNFADAIAEIHDET